MDIHLQTELTKPFAICGLCYFAQSDVRAIFPLAALEFKPITLTHEISDPTEIIHEISEPTELTHTISELTELTSKISDATERIPKSPSTESVFTNDEKRIFAIIHQHNSVSYRRRDNVEQELGRLGKHLAVQGMFYCSKAFVFKKMGYVDFVYSHCPPLSLYMCLIVFVTFCINVCCQPANILK